MKLTSVTHKKAATLIWQTIFWVFNSYIPTTYVILLYYPREIWESVLFPTTHVRSTNFQFGMCSLQQIRVSLLHICVLREFDLEVWGFSQIVYLFVGHDCILRVCTLPLSLPRSLNVARQVNPLCPLIPWQIRGMQAHTHTQRTRNKHKFPAWHPQVWQASLFWVHNCNRMYLY